MRIILLGSEESGKTSSGNTILGREAFALKKSAECRKTHGKVAGHQITVIDTPGRKRGYLASTTPQLYKDEVVRSVDHCLPGPHALLLVIKITSPFVPVCKDAVEDHLKLFGDNVWNHIIVLFTHGDQLDDKTIEEHIEDQGDPLKEVLKKCGDRYHVFNNMIDDNNQVHELFKKIDKMLEHFSDCFQMDRETLQRLMERKKEQDEKVKERMSLFPPQEELQSKTEDLRLVLLGYHSSGKSYAGEMILGAPVFGLKTVFASVLESLRVFGRKITVIDTPGWSREGHLKNTPAKSKEQIKHSMFLCPPGPHAFLLVIPVDTTFTEADERSIIDHVGLFGEEVWNYVIVVFSYADWMGDTAIEMYIESEGEALQRLVDKCGNRYHAFNNMICDKNQVSKLLDKIEHTIMLNSSHFGLEKMKSGSLQEDVEFEEKKQESEKDLNESPTSSGYGTCMHGSSGSIDNPPVMKTANAKHKIDHFKVA